MRKLNQDWGYCVKHRSSELFQCFVVYQEIEKIIWSILQIRLGEFVIRFVGPTNTIKGSNLSQADHRNFNQ